MALKDDMKLYEMEAFLSEEVKEQVMFEIAPILHLGYPPGGYFGVPRQILCMVDFLGALYSGFNPEKDYKDLKKKKGKKISSSKKALAFIHEIFGEIDENYKTNGKYLYEMYRHGLVHLYQPKELELEDGKVLTWLPHKGGRVSDIGTSDNRVIQNATHLSILKDSGRFFLPVSIKCLYSDLLSSIDLYLTKLKNSEDLQKKWVSAANEICKPDKFESNSNSEEEVGI